MVKYCLSWKHGEVIFEMKNFKITSILPDGIDAGKIERAIKRNLIMGVSGNIWFDKEELLITEL